MREHVLIYAMIAYQVLSDVQIVAKEDLHDEVGSLSTRAWHLRLQTFFYLSEYVLIVKDVMKHGNVERGSEVRVDPAELSVHDVVVLPSVP